MNRRVVVTGLGVVCPVGIGVEESWSNVIAGKSGIGPITRFDAGALKSRIAGEIKNFNAEDWLDKKLVSRLDVFIHYAMAAARMAIEDSCLTFDNPLAKRAGVVMGCGLGGLESMESSIRLLSEKGPGRTSPFFIPKIIGNMAPGVISMTWGLLGPNSSIQTACAAGNHAIGESFKIIERGDAEVMVTGGVEACVTMSAVAGFTAMRALSTRNDEPQRASRPFDADRDGFVIGEGSGVLILEERERALERGARIYDEIVGYGQSSDAHHFTAPHPQGDGAVNCMRMAINDAGIEPAELDYINAHGTSTDLNDRIETVAIKRVLGDAAKDVAISSTKSMTGHMLGGTAAVEAVFTALAIDNGIMPATINYETPDPDCDLDYVPNQAREREIKYAMSNSFGFGGTNAALVFAKHT